MLEATLQHIERYAAAHLDARPHARECAIAIARHMLAPTETLLFEFELQRRRGKSLGLALAVAAIARAAHDARRAYSMRVLSLSRRQSGKAAAVVLTILAQMGVPNAGLNEARVRLVSGTTITFSPFRAAPVPLASDGMLEEFVFIDESCFIDAHVLCKILGERAHVACVTTPTRESAARKRGLFRCERGYGVETACL